MADLRRTVEQLRRKTDGQASAALAIEPIEIEGRLAELERLVGGV